MGKITLNEQERVFVKEYIRTANAHASARAAGFEPVMCRQATTRILNRPEVARAISIARDKAVKKVSFTLEAALEEVTMRIEKADASDQHSAVAKLMELKMKLFGLLIEKHQVTTANFSLSFSGFNREPIPVDSEVRDVVVLEKKEDGEDEAEEDVFS